MKMLLKMPVNKQMATFGLIAYGLITSGFVFKFVNDIYQNDNLAKDLHILVKVNEARCLHKLKSMNYASQDMTSQLVTCMQEPSQIKRAQLKFLPVYSAREYSSPVEVDWFNYDSYDSYKSTMKNRTLLSAWSRPFDRFDHERLMKLFKMLTELLASKNIEFFLTEGTFLGSVRHFDLIPWDDDADILLNVKRGKDFVNLLRTQTTFTDLKLLMIDRQKYKVFLSTGVKAGRFKWTYPFIDVFFYDEGLTQIYRKVRKKLVTTPKAEIFPLKLRPFGKYWLPTPKNASNFLKRFDDFQDVCIRGDWSHCQEIKQKSYNTTCSFLRQHFQFVSINCFSTGAIEICLEMIAITSKSYVYLIYNNSQPMTLRLDF